MKSEMCPPLNESEIQQYFTQWQGDHTYMHTGDYLNVHVNNSRRKKYICTALVEIDRLIDGKYLGDESITQPERGSAIVIGNWVEELQRTTSTTVGTQTTAPMDQSDMTRSGH